MTSQSPRIYIYKITFEEVPYYYYGSKKEKYYNQEYWGSPKTNKWCWELYTPKKQILELFDYTDEGYVEAQGVEKRLIKPVYNTDKWCLNRNCGGLISLKILRESGRKVGTNYGSEGGKIGGKISGKINGKYLKENKLGIFSLTEEEKIENCKKGGNKIGQIHKENGTGICGIPIEERRKNSKKGGKISGEKHKKNGTGVFGRSKEKMTEDGKRGGKKAAETNKKNGTSFYGIPIEERRKNSRKAEKITNSQKWECCETGYVSTAAGVVSYQKGRKIDTSKSNRRRIQ
jgi:hypothetical protein